MEKIREKHCIKFCRVYCKLNTLHEQNFADQKEKRTVCSKLDVLSVKAGKKKAKSRVVYTDENHF